MREKSEACWYKLKGELERVMSVNLRKAKITVNVFNIYVSQMEHKKGEKEIFGMFNKNSSLALSINR